ncbi:MAG: DNA mismatch repair endonuclease MutL [Armatimonadetes bacterium]|nr:DNA mismatch repair endonuclease MutL [Armatimonadota bacterium]
MPRIRRLPDILANRIAAGEVVERPASVVKELVENSIDAGARRVEVELERGGTRLIVVTDDGCGMDREDALLAVERFATSKISSADDLHRISTMGFRGEALPSIAAVSRMRIITRPPEAESGTLVVVEGGAVRKVESIGCPPGTRVEVADLFFNTPARRKFLSSINTERGHCHDWIVRLAMARTSISFRLTHDRATLLATRGDGDLLAVIAAVYGANAAREFIPVSFSAEGLSVSGYVSGPRILRATRQHQLFFVNCRFVRSRVLSHALTEAYGALLPASRQPMCVLHLALPPEEVDPNVHPTKIEVKLAREGWVHDRVIEAVGAALESAGLRPAAARAVAPGSASRGADYAAASRLRIGPLVDKLDARDDGLDVHGLPATVHRKARPLRTEPARGEPPRPVADRQAEAVPGHGTETAPRAVGQLGGRYIVVLDGDRLLLVDQHRAAERVIFDKLARRSSPRQYLALPIALELSPRQASAAEDHHALLAELGFEIERFGPSSWLLRSVPADAAYRAPEQMVSDLLDDLAEWQAPSTAETREEQARAMVACHAAITAGQRLTDAEMQRLIDELFATTTPAVCPHGDPIIAVLEAGEIDGRFERRSKQ